MSVATITQLYIGYFGRAADPAGLNYWVGQENAGMQLADIARSFAVQTEATTNYPYLALPNIASSAGFITQVYQNLFNRAPDAEGMTYWQGQLASGRSVGQVILDIINGAQGDDATIVANKVEAAAFYTDQVVTQQAPWTLEGDRDDATAVLSGVTADPTTVDTSKALAAELVAAAKAGTGTPGAILTLTSGNDYLSPAGDTASTRTTAGDDTIRAMSGGHLGDGDVIDGGAGRDTLNAVVGGAFLVPSTVAPMLRNVEVVNITSGASRGTVTFDASNSTGIEQIVNRTTSSRDVEVVGIDTSVIVGMSSSGGSSLTVNFTGVSGKNDAATLLLDSNDGGIFTAEGIERLNIKTSGTTSWVDVAEGDYTALNISGSAALNLYNSDDGVTVIDASTLTGALTLEGATLTKAATVTGGSGADDITLYSDKAVTLDGGAGDDELSVYADANNTVNGGDGADDITVMGDGNQTVDGGDGADDITVMGEGNHTVGGGNGNDTLNVYGNGNHTVSGGAGNDVITVMGDGVHSISGGAGADKFMIAGMQLGDVDLEDAAALVEAATKVTDLAAGETVAFLGATFAELTGTQQARAAAAEDLVAALDYLLDLDNVDGKSVAFAFGDSTYVLVNDNEFSNGLDDLDGLVQLVGVTTFSLTGDVLTA
ncbi:DUF4214 domain-containing protein [Roseomonas marmotae]|uniref:DUF4214 domain-containing protein n=1 Tax=Roseomonas marmotae TaxID=2768161 RepID=A0ABS3KHH4_9PROT|nr:DUF4214 domain-containing protein [Roseomonas marmotae]MBO1076890.1 DUF4214 domain-containing protein [Roseomonas marmotae]QTI81139.1 DUF4214 domain-containing protein [Roseomonas marmotae]